MKKNSNSPSHLPPLTRNHPKAQSSSSIKPKHRTSARIREILIILSLRYGTISTLQQSPAQVNHHEVTIKSTQPSHADVTEQKAGEQTATPNARQNNQAAAELAYSSPSLPIRNSVADRRGAVSAAVSASQTISIDQRMEQSRASGRGAEDN